MTFRAEENKEYVEAGVDAVGEGLDDSPVEGEEEEVGDVED